MSQLRKMPFIEFLLNILKKVYLTLRLVFCRGATYYACYISLWVLFVTK